LTCSDTVLVVTLVAGGDLGECASGAVAEEVVVEHDPGPLEVQWAEHPVRQLGHHLRGGHP
jgi:hypothetical protein